MQFALVYHGHFTFSDTEFMTYLELIEFYGKLVKLKEAEAEQYNKNTLK
jgi:hypothetical protein